MTEPSNDRLEQLLLGALLTDNKRLADVGGLKPEHFGSAQHQRLFEMMRFLAARQVPFVPKTLTPMLNGEASYVADMAANAVMSTPLTVTYWAREVVNLDCQRRLLAVSSDIPRIFTEAKGEHSYAPRLEAVFEEIDNLRKAWRKDAPESGEQFVLSLDEWDQHPVPEPDFLLGELMSTTSRMMLVGPTGLGKTNLLMAMSMAVALGEDFLHWRGGGQPRKVLYIDGEMSLRQFDRRRRDAVARCPYRPTTWFGFNHEHSNVPLLLDTSKGQEAVERRIEHLGGVDMIVFDNVNFLFTRDDNFGADSWHDGHPWRSDLMHRAIGQIWAHHTGHDESHGYGSKTREWGVDTVAIMERTDDPSLVSFRLNFPKARERGLENYRDFDTATIVLAENDRWASERGGDHKRAGRVSPKGRAFLDALIDALAKAGTRSPQSGNRPAVSQAMWDAECVNHGLVDETQSHDARRMISKYRLELLGANLISCNQGLVWAC